MQENPQCFHKLKQDFRCWGFVNLKIFMKLVLGIAENKNKQHF